MPIKLNGATNGSVELDVPAAVGSDLQITLPSTAGTAIVKAADGSVDLGSVDIDSSGNLGIGTSSAASLGSGFTEVMISGSTEGAGLQLQDTDGNVKAGIFTSDNSNTATLRTITNHPLTFRTNNTERMRIDSSGVLTVGSGANTATQRAAFLGGYTTFENSAGTGNPSITFNNDTDTGILNPSGNTIAFNTGGSERMRLDDGGRLLVGTTTGAYKLQVEASTAVAKFHHTDTGNNIGIIFQHARGLSGFAGKMVSMQRNDGGEVGSIVIGVSSTAFNTTSDYRLKENVVDIDGAINRVKQLTPRRFNFIDDADRIVDGFLAHEAQAVVPEAVTGQKDATKEEEYVVTPAVEEVVDEEGNVTTAAVDAVMGTRIVPDYQGIDQSKLVPLLTAALQEAIAKIETLEARVTTLEAG